MAEKKSSTAGAAGADSGDSGKVKTATLYPIESLGATIDPAVFAGVCAMQGWDPGKQVSRQDWNAAVKRFMGSPISGPGEG